MDLPLKRGKAFKLFGPAGTGKTTMANDLAKNYQTVFLSYTGKAASRMRECGCKDASTIHRALYKCKKEDRDFVFYYAPSTALLQAELVVIDECSMCPYDLANDLFKANPNAYYLVLGDPCQLPPIEPANAPFYGEPDLLLTEVYRQALDSPILEYATRIRESQDYRVAPPESIREIDDPLNMGSEIILCGTNKTRMRINDAYYNMSPDANHPMIVLQNNYDYGVFNGEIYDLETLRANNYPLADSRTNSRKKVIVDYAYAITVHKSQGSQWDRVTLVPEEAACFKEMAWRWLYTGVTRAAKELTLAGVL